MNRAYISAVGAAASELARAAHDLLAADAHATSTTALCARIPPEHWPQAVTEAADRRLKDAQWRFDHLAASARRLTAKEPT